MTHNDSRRRTRRQNERRTQERRADNYPFGSPEWLNRLQQENLLYPKQDRRRCDRRSQERRKKPRRVSNGNEARVFKVSSLHQLLTQEEKQMLSDLMREDDN